nr:MAG TPA: hypothetical protein [Caudoviricetes sp.]
MTIAKKIQSTEARIGSVKSKLGQLAQMQDQLIAEHNKLIGKLEAYKELEKEAEKTEVPEIEADIESD